MQLKLLLALLSLTVSLCIVEIVLRYQGVIPETNRFVAYEFDPEIGWTTRKGFTIFKSTPYYGHFTYYDRDGLACPPQRVASALAPEKPTLLLIGDSYAEGYYLPYQQSIAGQLELAFPQLQVADIGVSGYAPDQYLLATRRSGMKFNVTAAVVLFFPLNDVPYIKKASYQGYAKPLFGPDLSKPSNTPLLRSEGKDHQRSLPSRIARNSAIYSFLRPLFRALLMRGEADTEAVAEYSLTEFDRALRFMRQIGTELRKPLFVYYVPAPQEVAAPQALERNLTAFGRACESAQLSCVLPSWRNDAAAQSYYIKGDGHFTAVGAAEVVSDISGVVGAALELPNQSEDT